MVYCKNCFHHHACEMADSEGHDFIEFDNCEDFVHKDNIVIKKEAEWKVTTIGNDIHSLYPAFECSECGELSILAKHAYCPGCGAKMKNAPNGVTKFIKACLTRDDKIEPANLEVKTTLYYVCPECGEFIFMYRPPDMLCPKCKSKMDALDRPPHRFLKENPYLNKKGDEL